MDWWRGNASEAGSRRRAAGRAVPKEEVQSALEAHGISHEFSARLAEQLEPRIAKLDAPAARAAMIEGVALALDLQQETNHDVARSLRGLKEVERMMGAFSGELSKLDEVLEVLAAYVRRMKTSGATDPSRTLH